MLKTLSFRTINTAKSFDLRFESKLGSVEFRTILNDGRAEATLPNSGPPLGMGLPLSSRPESRTAGRLRSRRSQLMNE